MAQGKAIPKIRIPLNKCGFCKKEVVEFGKDCTFLFMDKRTTITICSDCYFKSFNHVAEGVKKAYSLTVQRDAVRTGKPVATSIKKKKVVENNGSESIKR